MQAPSASQLTFTDCKTEMITFAFMNQVIAQASDGTQATDKCLDKNMVHLNQSGLNDSVANLKTRKKQYIKLICSLKAKTPSVLNVIILCTNCDFFFVSFTHTPGLCSYPVLRISRSKELIYHFSFISFLHARDHISSPPEEKDPL